MNIEYMVDYLPDKRIVFVKVRGRLNFQVAEKYSREALKLARQNNCTKFIFDHTATNMSGGVNKLHASGDELQQFGFTNLDRIAIMVSDFGANPTLLDPVNHNSRWSSLKYFSAGDDQEVLDWLFVIEK